MLNRQVAVGVASTAILDANSGARSLLVKHTTAGATVFLGAPGVTVATGYPLEANNELELELEGPLHGVVAAGTVTVFVLGV